MKALSLELFAILALAALAAGATYLVRGAPNREIACDEASLKPGHLCYSQLAELGDFLWVDARKREQWERDGMKDSVFLTDDPKEDWDTLFAESFEKLASASAVVVYCDTEKCGSSEPVAAKIREAGLLANPDAVYVLHGGARALPIKDTNRKN